jgi:hypothetical protein
MERIVRSAERVALPVSDSPGLASGIITPTLTYGTVAVRRQRTPSPHQAPGRARSPLDPPCARMQPLHPTNVNRHTTFAGRLRFLTRGALFYLPPYRPLHSRYCWLWYQQGLLLTRHERPGTRVARWHGWLQVRLTLYTRFSGAMYRCCERVSAGFAAAR